MKPIRWIRNCLNFGMSDTLLDCIMEDEIYTKPQIKHIVCSGGGTFGLTAYGILKQSCLDGFWKINDIKTMYGTSVGAIICMFLSLLSPVNGEGNGLTWDLLDTYIIHRPWQHVFKMDLYAITNSLENGGILNKKAIYDVFSPLFKTLDIDTQITLQEHYDMFGIELHVYSTELESMELVDISYKTHPNMCMLDAVYSSCSLPLLFSPYVRDNKTYFDGGLFCNYPLYFCFKNVENKDEIMGLKCNTNATESSAHNNNSFSTLFDYILKIFKNLTTKINNYELDCKIPHELDIPSPEISIYDIYLAIMNSDKRKQMIEDGILFWKTHNSEYSKL